MLITGVVLKVISVITGPMLWCVLHKIAGDTFGIVVMT